LDDEIDLVLPWWWIQKHQPSGWLEGETVKFDHPRCINKCTRHNASAFSIEYDPHVLELIEHGEEAVSIMVVTATDNGDTVQSLKQALTKEYHKYIKVFLPETAKALPEHREWDHAIDLIDGAKPPWGTSKKTDLLSNLSKTLKVAKTRKQTRLSGSANHLVRA
jgi:hypothetical protein